MNKLRVLHITPWFPHLQNLNEGLFIQNHILSLKDYAESAVLHIRFSEKSEYIETNVQGVFSVTYISKKLLVNRWRMREWQASKIVRHFLLENAFKFDIIVFVIAYPNGINLGKLKVEFPNLKFAIFEHWSAYRRNFNLKAESLGRRRIVSIFSNRIPLFVVSNALGEDIQNFINSDKLSYTVIPNCIDTSLFKPTEKLGTDKFTFVTINNWSNEKNPDVLLESFKILVTEFPDVELVFGGEGPGLEKVKVDVTRHGIADKVRFTGALTKEEVCALLQKSDSYCQSSIYETFSVICIEALSTGMPVIANNIGGMKEYIHERNGILINGLNVNDWVKAMKEILVSYGRFNKGEISSEIMNKFSSEKIGKQYYQKLLELKNTLDN